MDARDASHRLTRWIEAKCLSSSGRDRMASCHPEIERDGGMPQAPDPIGLPTSPQRGPKPIQPRAHRRSTNSGRPPPKPRPPTTRHRPTQPASLRRAPTSGRTARTTSTTTPTNVDGSTLHMYAGRGRAISASEDGGWGRLVVHHRLVTVATVSGSCGFGLTRWGIENVEMPVGGAVAQTWARPVPEGDRSAC